MKAVLFIITALLAANTLQAKTGNYAFTGKEDSTFAYFVVLYKTGKNWDAAKAPNEQAHFSDHSKFLSSLRKQEIIKAGARYSDVGMLIIKAKDLQAAEALVKTDLAVQNETFNVAVYEAGFFYKGCID